jgi:threonine synthase
MLRFYSTNGQAAPVNLREALLHGQAPDRGLYLPESFPRLTTAELAGLSYPDIAFAVLRRFTTGVLDDDTLRALCADAYNFDVPLERVHDRVHVLRLDRGPTASFKDFAARMMARWLGRFVREDGRRLTILTATSGGQRVSRRARHPRAGAVSDQRGQRPATPADDHLARQRPQHRGGRQVR